MSGGLESTMHDKLLRKGERERERERERKRERENQRRVCVCDRERERERETETERKRKKGRDCSELIDGCLFACKDTVVWTLCFQLLFHIP
jgi:hypothetical protein